jgi:hypothetical protein
VRLPLSSPLSLSLEKRDERSEEREGWSSDWVGRGKNDFSEGSSEEILEIDRFVECSCEFRGEGVNTDYKFVSR